MLTTVLVTATFASAFLAQSLPDKVILVPGENLLPVKCEVVQGSIEQGDNIVSIEDPNLGGLLYDTYTLQVRPGTIVFIETSSQVFKPTLHMQIGSAPIQEYRSVNILGIFRLERRSSSGGGPFLSQTVTGFPSAGISYYADPGYIEEDKAASLTLYSGTRDAGVFGSYALRVAIAEPSSDLSSEQVTQAMPTPWTPFWERLEGYTPGQYIDALCTKN